MPEDRGGLQISEDLSFQRGEWRLQRAGWIALCLFILAALLGLFGGGPASHGRAGDPGGPLWIEYERFVRQGAAERFTIHLAPATEPRTALEIRISRPYLEGIRIGRIVPEPAAIEVGPREAVLHFTGASAQTTGIVFDAEPATAGLRSATVSAGGGALVSLWQFVYF